MSARILIVEDERIVARDIQQSLVGLGYDAFAIASSADEALARIDERRPDLILMDIRIRGSRDGIETATEIRALHGIPVVFLTAHADDATLARAKCAEPYSYLLKPLKLAELRSAIEISLHKREMERKARERELWYATTLRSIADAVISVSDTGKVTFVNASAEALTGVRTSDALGYPVEDVLRFASSDIELSSLWGKRTETLRGRALVAGPSGEPAPVVFTASPVVVRHEGDDAGTKLGSVIVLRNVAEEDRAREATERADRLASLATLVGGLTHEVGNPLFVIMTNGSSVEEELGEHRRALARLNVTLDEDAATRLDVLTKMVGHVRQGVTRIARVVEDLGTFTMTERGAFGGRAELVSVADKAIRAMGARIEQRARVIVDLGVQPVSIDCPEPRLAQLLTNLLTNALEAIPPGSRHTNEVRISLDRRNPKRVVLEITDTGIGIPDEVRERIFDPLFTTKGVGFGTGLGLPACRTIVSALDGELSFTSAPGAGTTFRVTLPVAT